MTVHKYCYECESVVPVYGLGVDRKPWHMIDSFVSNYLICRGPFMSCPPPEFEMTNEWVQSLVPPTDDELLVMHLNSLELEMDFS